MALNEVFFFGGGGDLLLLFCALRALRGRAGDGKGEERDWKRGRRGSRENYHTQRFECRLSHFLFFVFFYS